jgi:hypothetical protein
MLGVAPSLGAAPSVLWLNARLHPLLRMPGDPMALTRSRLVTAVAERAELSKSDTKRALGALEDVALAS